MLGLHGEINVYFRGVPKTWDELYDMCTFFQGREIDGVVRYGAAINTERGSEGITMGGKPQP